MCIFLSCCSSNDSPALDLTFVPTPALHCTALHRWLQMSVSCYVLSTYSTVNNIHVLFCPVLSTLILQDGRMAPAVASTPIQLPLYQSPMQSNLCRAELNSREISCGAQQRIVSIHHTSHTAEQPEVTHRSQECL
jgi:hypothetical protein